LASAVVLAGVAAISGPAAGGVVYSGYLPFQGPATGTTEPKIITSGPFDETHTASNFFGTNTVRAVLDQKGAWGVRVMTYSDVQNVTLTGGNLQEVTASVSVSRMGHIAGAAPYPASLKYSGHLTGRVEVGTNSLHDGSLTFGNTIINHLEDFFLVDEGVYTFNIPLTTTVPVDSSGSYPIAFALSSESWSRIGVTSGDFQNTLEVTSITLADGQAPETQGWSLSFDDGAVSPNISADFNADGYVEAADLATWAAGFGAPEATRVQGDATLDRAVDGADFLIWQLNQGSGGPLTPAATVPEPVVTPLALVAIAACLRGTRRQRTARR
jgi:hypothetical protein